MDHGRPRRAAAFLCLPLAALLWGCRPAGERPAVPAGPGVKAAVPARTGGRFVFPLPIEPATLNFVSGTDIASAVVLRVIGEPLVDHDVRLKTTPCLASSWDLSGDGRVLTFHLREGVRFHDGAPFTSDDVLFTYERIVDPKSRAVGRADGFQTVERVEALDPGTVRVVYREPYAPALRSWEVPILPAHLYRGADFATAKQNRAPVGTGPFRFVSWEPGQQIVVEANPGYWGGVPSIDTFVFRVMPAPETNLPALLAGEIDFARLSPTQWEARRHDPEFQRRFRDVGYVPLYFNFIVWRGDGSNPFFTDPRVRRAMTLALDREGYVRSVLKGLGRVTASPFQDLLPLDAAHEPSAESKDPAGTAAADQPEHQGRGARPLAHDPALAGRLLDEAGWRIDPRSGLRTRAGRQFRFTLLIYSSGENHVQFAQVAQDDLRRLGIRMSIERLDWQTLWSRLKSGSFQAALSGMIPAPDPDSIYGLLHSSQIQGGQNYASYRDAETDAWLDAGRRTVDAVVREGLYRRVEERLVDQQPYTFLFNPAVPAVLNARFEGIEPSPLGLLGSSPGAAGLRLRREPR